MSVNKKRAFTIIELVISICILAFVAAVAPYVVFKKDKFVKKVVSDRINSFVCYSDSTYSEQCPECVTYNKETKVCDFELTPEMISKEFIEVRLIGAGAKGDNKNQYCAGAGEERSVIYPSLTMPFARLKPRTPDSPMCEKFNQSGGKCQKCVKGYKLQNGVCEINFKYRAIIGQAPDGNEADNGGATYFGVVELNDDGTDGEFTILETALGGTIANKTLNSINDCKNESTSSEYESGSTGKGGEVRISW